MKDKHRQMIALSLEMIRHGKRMETEKRRLKELADGGTGYDSPEIRAALERYLREKAAWEKAEQSYLALRNDE